MTRRAVPFERLRDPLGSRRGLTATEVSGRRERYGANAIVEALQDSPRPTRAEVTDVVTMMAAIFADAESSFSFDAWINFRKGWRNVLPVVGT